MVFVTTRRILSIHTKFNRVFRVMRFLFFMDYSNMRIQSDIKIKKAIRLIDERIHLLTKIKREWNDKQKDKLLPDNERTGTELLDSMKKTTSDKRRISVK